MDWKASEIWGFRGAGVLWTPLPKAEAMTEPAGETPLTSVIAVRAPNRDAC